jgi:hypothetical protein
MIQIDNKVSPNEDLLLVICLIIVSCCIISLLYNTITHARIMREHENPLQAIV